RWATVVTLILLGTNIILPVVMLFARLEARFSPVKIWTEFWPQVRGSLTIGYYAAVVAAIVAISAVTHWTRGLLAIAIVSFLIGGQILAISVIRISNRSGLI